MEIYIAHVDLLAECFSLYLVVGMTEQIGVSADREGIGDFPVYIYLNESGYPSSDILRCQDLQLSTIY